VNVSAGAGVATGNTVRLSSLNIGAQTLEAQGANGYKLEFGQSTFTAAPTFQPTTADLTLRGNISGSFGFTKSGAGRLVLTDATTFVGAVTVQAGTLVVNGSTAAGSNVTVTGGTLAGTGTIGGNVALTQAGANLAPGEALPGILSIDGNLALAAGTSFTVNLSHGLGPQPVPGADYDQVNVGVAGTSSVALGGATLTLNLGAGLLQNDLFFIVLNDGNDAVSGTFAGLPDDSVFFLNSLTFQISYNANSISGQFNGGNDVALMMIPEPGSALLLAGGTLLLASRRRRED
jgi:autotransporter-associated beta strand protein